MEQIEYNPELLFAAIKSKLVPEIRKIFENYNLIDIAETLNGIEEVNEYAFIFKTISPEYTSEVFAYLEPEVQESIINLLTGEQISHLIDYLNSDDLVDFIQELPVNMTTKILQATPKERRTQINQLLNYQEFSAGSIMTTEYIALKEKDTMQTVLEKVKKFGRRAETISYLFVTDDKKLLKGTLRLKDIIFMESSETVGDIMEEDFVSVTANTDQEEVAKTFKKYDMNAIPVTTSDGRLVGIITADDIIDVIEEEATEDIYMMANVNPLEEEYMKTGVFNLARKGAGWLVLLMLLSTFTSFIMNSYEEAMVIVPCLSIFVPMLIGTAGNAGNQSSAVITRGLAIGEVETRDFWHVLFKEIRVAVVVGIITTIVNFAWVFLLSNIGIIDLSISNVSSLQLSSIVSVAMFVSILLSKIVGASLPIIVKKMKIDPAMLAGPMVTTVVDATTLIIYFLIATKLFEIL